MYFILNLLTEAYMKVVILFVKKIITFLIQFFCDFKLLLPFSFQLTFTVYAENYYMHEHINVR